MCTAHSTPDQYGLAIRTYPDTLMVTARNKQGAGREGEKSADLDGKAIQVTAFDRNPEELEYNESQALALLKRLDVGGYTWERRNGILYHDVPSSLIIDYLSKYHNSSQSQTSVPAPAIRHIEKLDNLGCDRWYVYVASGEASQARRFEFDVHSLIRELRKPGEGTTKDCFIVSRRMLASRGAEKVMLSPEESERAERIASEKKPGKNFSSADYLYVATNPILVLHPLALAFKPGAYDRWNPIAGEKQEIWPSADHTEYTVGWSIGFPRKGLKPEPGYMINDVLHRQQLSYEDESEEARPDD